MPHPPFGFAHRSKAKAWALPVRSEAKAGIPLITQSKEEIDYDRGESINAQHPHTPSFPTGSRAHTTTLSEL